MYPMCSLTEGSELSMSCLLCRLLKPFMSSISLAVLYGCWLNHNKLLSGLPLPQSIAIVFNIFKYEWVRWWYKGWHLHEWYDLGTNEICKIEGSKKEISSMGKAVKVSLKAKGKHILLKIHLPTVTRWSNSRKKILNSSHYCENSMESTLSSNLTFYDTAREIWENQVHVYILSSPNISEPYLHQSLDLKRDQSTGIHSSLILVSYWWLSHCAEKAWKILHIMSY